MSSRLVCTNGKCDLVMPTSKCGWIKNDQIVESVEIEKEEEEKFNDSKF